MSDSGKIIYIGIAELNIAKSPDRISTLGLGSCVGVVLFDRFTRIAGMVHVLLPSWGAFAAQTNKAKFADTGVVELLNVMIQNGAQRGGISAKIAGGAHMFEYSNADSDLLRIGQKNVQMCKGVLSTLKIPLLAEDTEGKCGRTITFDPASGMLHIRTIGKGEYAI